MEKIGGEAIVVMKGISFFSVLYSLAKKAGNISRPLIAAHKYDYSNCAI